MYESMINKLGNKISSIDFKDIYITNIQDLIDCNLQPYWKQKNNFYPIILVNIISKRKLYIIDGQDRYLSLQKLPENQRKNNNIQIDVLNYNNEDEEMIIKQYEKSDTKKQVITIFLIIVIITLMILPFKNF